ncbi:hypothetical protein D3C72_1398750 [compost metagenome]
MLALEALLHGELLGALAHQQHVRAALHHFAGHRHRMQDVDQRSDRATAAIAIHDAGVQAQHAVAVRVAAMADRGVAQLAFGPACTGFHRIQRTAALRQHLPRGLVGRHAEVPGRYHLGPALRTRLHHRQRCHTCGQCTGLQELPAIHHLRLRLHAAPAGPMPAAPINRARASALRARPLHQARPAGHVRPATPAPGAAHRSAHPC